MPKFLTKDEEKILELETRRKVYDIVKKNAGCHFREIERRSGMATGSVQYHLAYLTKYDLIKEEKDNHAVRYFPKSVTTANKKVLGFLRQKSIRRILLYILMHEHCHQEHIVDAVKKSASTVSWHLKKLQEAGIVAPVKNGRKVLYALKEKQEMMMLLMTYQESFYDTLIDNIIEMWEIE